MTTTQTTCIHADANDYRVDDAGYIISTGDQLTGIGQAIADIGASLSGLETEYEWMSGMLAVRNDPAPTIRAEYAAKLRKQIHWLEEIAASLDGPPIDERNSPRVAWDAKHSVL